MTYTYLGTKEEREWIPLAMANGIADRRLGTIEGNLYRWHKAPLCALLYWIGRHLLS